MIVWITSIILEIWYWILSFFTQKEFDKHMINDDYILTEDDKPILTENNTNIIK